MSKYDKCDPSDYAFSSPPASGSLGVRGLTKREYFAGLAMQGNISASRDWTYTQEAEAAILSADALIAELNKEAER